MRKAILLLSILSFNLLSFGQSSLSIEYGQNFTKFKFINDQNTQFADLTSNFSNSFTLGYSYSLDQGVFFSSKIGVRQAGASYVFENFNYQWDLHYSEFRLGVGYHYGLGPVHVHFSTQGYLGYLFKAEQRLHNNFRDMLAEETVRPIDVGLFFSPGVTYPLNDNIDLGLDINYMLGLTNIEMDENQQTTNNMIGASIGLNIKL